MIGACCLSWFMIAAEVPQGAHHDALLNGAVWVRAGREGSGTGFIVDRERRWVVTCRHVIGDRKRVQLIFPRWEKGELIPSRTDHTPDQVTHTEAELIRLDEMSDLVLLRADRLPEDAVALPLATASGRPGERVFMVGNRSDLPTLWNYSRGTVRQIVPASDGYFWRGRRLAEGARLVRVDLPAHEGDSGAAVVDASGRVLGVLAATLPGMGDPGVLIDLSHLRTLLDRPPPTGPDNESLFTQLARGTAWLEPMATSRTCHGWLVDRERRLLIASASGLGRADVVTVLFPFIQAGEVESRPQAYRDGFWVRRSGRYVRGWVLARDSERDLALVEVESLPSTAQEFQLSDVAVNVGDELHTISNPVGGKVRWLYSRGWVSQRLRLPAGPSLAVRLPIGRTESGMPLTDDQGAIRGMVIGERLAAGTLPVAVSVEVIRQFLNETRPWRTPRDAEEFLRRGRYFARRSRANEAHQSFLEATRLAPDDSMPWLELSASWSRLGHPERARKAAEQALELAPDLATTHVQYAATRTPDDPSRDTHLRQAFRLDPSCVQAHLLVAEIALQKGDRQAVEQAARQALDTDADRPEAYEFLAHAFDTPLDQQRRLGVLNQLLAREPHHVGALGLRAKDHISRRRWKEARGDLMALLAVQPQSSGSWVWLARVRHELGDDQAALHAWAEAVYTEGINQARRLAVPLP